MALRGEELLSAINNAGIRWHSFSGSFPEYMMTSWQSPREVREALEGIGCKVISSESDPVDNMITIVEFIVE